jgi:hypothetical protein
VIDGRALDEGAKAQALLSRVLGGEHGRLGPARQSQLGKHRAYVVLDRLLRQLHRLSDLPVGHPLADQLQDPTLLPRERRQRGILLRSPAQALQDLLGDRRGPGSTGHRPPGVRYL